jgi:hypothetical protein
MPIENVSKVEIQFHAALFDDGNTFLRPGARCIDATPNDSHKWIKIDK